jgi:uncharacterized protein with FMN-binding domain
MRRAVLALTGLVAGTTPLISIKSARSAHIDTYSGVTWTSDASRTSLRSAIDKAGLG